MSILHHIRYFLFTVLTIAIFVKNSTARKVDEIVQDVDENVDKVKAIGTVLLVQNSTAQDLDENAHDVDENIDKHYYGFWDIIDRVSKIPGNLMEKVKGWPWCDEDLGCLYAGDEWYDAIHRPVNALPHRRDSIRTRFFIHTRESRNRDYNHQVTAYQTWTLLQQYGFDSSKPTKFIIHGYLDHGNLAWLKEFAQELLDYGDYNVLRVDWGGGSRASIPDACANTRVVGLEVGYLVNWMVREFGMDPANVHLIGHSFGAHVTGYAGEKIPGLGRISGLDPAGIFFAGMPAFVRLDPSDAVFVDNIHTDGAQTLVLGLGTQEPMGHLDFYPNGGRIQPGCDPVTNSIFSLGVSGGLYDNAQQFLLCSHIRARTLYRNSLKQSCQAFECSDYWSFKVGRCQSCGDNNKRCSQVGIKASEYAHKQRSNVKMYYDTYRHAPFCK